MLITKYNLLLWAYSRILSNKYVVEITYGCIYIYCICVHTCVYVGVKACVGAEQLEACQGTWAIKRIEKTAWSYKVIYVYI